ncbi:ATP-citrate synthase alpha chain protein 1 [Orobanche minor]
MMRGLGRSIVCKRQAFRCNNTNRSIISSSSDGYTLSTRFNSSRSTPFLHFSRCIHLGANPENMLNKKVETNQGSSFNLSVVMKAFRKGKVLLRGLQEGDTVDLYDLLFTKDRDYLIKCNGGQKVKAEQLEGMVVVIYFDSVLNIDLKCLKSLTYIYNDLHPKNGFEVVFVDVSNSNPSGLLGVLREEEPGVPFENVFPKMPWLAIPLSRKHLKQEFGLPERIFGGHEFIIGPTSTILHWSGCDILRKYGAAGYPFDKHRINLLESEDNEAVKSPSLNALLASCERDYLIKNNGEKKFESSCQSVVIGAGIANFTDVTATFNGIIRALKEKSQSSKLHIYVGRGGPNYQRGLAKMRSLGEEIGIPIEVYGPEETMTGICKTSSLLGVPLYSA